MKLQLAHDISIAFLMLLERLPPEERTAFLLHEMFGALVKPAILLKFHKALVDRKYRLLFSSSPHRRKPGPKGPAAQLVAPIVAMKRRNPKFGCVRIAQQIPHAFGLDIIEHAKDSLWSRPVPLRVDPAEELLGHGRDGHLHAPRHWLRCRAC